MTRLRRFAASAKQARAVRFAASAKQAREVRCAASTSLALGLLCAFIMLGAPSICRAHSGPPFPILTDAVRGPYLISIWTDPDTTDNGTPGGQFWIVIGAADKRQALASDTRATVAVRPSTPSPASRSGEHSVRTEPVRGDITNQFGAVLMDHEGPYVVHVEVSGSMGQAVAEAMVEATYDLRPAPYMLIWYLLPFLAVGFLWTRLLLRRRTVGSGPV